MRLSARLLPVNAEPAAAISSALLFADAHGDFEPLAHAHAEMSYRWSTRGALSSACVGGDINDQDSDVIIAARRVGLLDEAVGQSVGGWLLGHNLA